MSTLGPGGLGADLEFSQMFTHSEPTSCAPGSHGGSWGWLPSFLRCGALLGAVSTHLSLDVQLVLELPDGQCFSGPGLFPPDEAV